MSKKIMLIVLTAVSAALLALPAVASTQEIHFESGANQNFSLSGGAGEIRANGEPTYTCEATDGTGAQTSSTTGTMTFDFTGCHINVLGFTVKCRSAGSALDNTIATGGTYHLITWKNTSGTAFPAMLITMNTTTVMCGGTTLYLTGDVIGTITSPTCGNASKTLGLSFTAMGTVQNHMEYTGVKYDLKSSTKSDHSEEKTSALVGTNTITAANEATLNCT